MPAGETQGLEVRLERAVAGGVVLGRDVTGRVVLVEGALPGERATVALRRDTARMAAGVATRILAASADRLAPPCPLVAEGCGGCDLQHATPLLQRGMRLEVVRDALSHLARRTGVPVEQVDEIPQWGYRTSMRLGVVRRGANRGRLGLRHRRSDDLVATPTCMVAHPLLVPVLAEGRFPGATEVSVRASATTGEVLVVATPSARGCTVPQGVRLLGADDLARGERAWVTEHVEGHHLRVSAGSFFQAGPEGAAALGRAVGRAFESIDPVEERIVDLYGGIGLFTVLLGARRAVVVERSASAVADARVNTRGLGAAVVKVSVGRWRPSPADAVVADPSREGLGVEGAAAVAATGARVVALVSCDPAALGRDVTLLAASGYEPTRVEVVDMFPNTHHVEAVTTLVRDRGAS